ncbi:NUDIX hydrolase [Solitalea canadensis]|uniref:ADP-ribose pyrophosphatase n=1 Tax=Solitalea canadensis (strain ATCC 29591 / DSM 3403 / JCM 21819 / LMG 8368 / NBRC 15130 / NCIMB 12057 / USAM 9D) TaxID=929556 RepID=H8KPV2_SOLCM|nr:NUDIX domain-containing protein [Solitalea canadensis]AFD06000.1 ADP-ribose pyrophosphatase [Solitalea canadensis DSM 3403]
MAQRYRIYIKDTPLFICPPAESSNSKTLTIVNEHNIDEIVRKILHNNASEPLLLESNSPDNTLHKLCKKFHFIEAAGGLVKNSLEEYLFIHRLGKWDLPKGKLEKNESIMECAIREVEEECGITINRIIEELPSTYHMYELKGKIVLKRTYWFSMEYTGEQQLTPQTEEDITEVEWLPKEQFNKVIDNTYPAIKELISTI